MSSHSRVHDTRRGGTVHGTRRGGTLRGGSPQGVTAAHIPVLKPPAAFELALTVWLPMLLRAASQLWIPAKSVPLLGLPAPPKVSPWSVYTVPPKTRCRARMPTLELQAPLMVFLSAP